MTTDANQSSYLSSVVPSNTNMAAVRASGGSAAAASLNVAACQRYFIQSTNVWYFIRFSGCKIIWQPIKFYRTEAWLRLSQEPAGSCHDAATLSAHKPYSVLLPLLWHYQHVTKKWLSPRQFCTHFSSFPSALHVRLSNQLSRNHPNIINIPKFAGSNPAEAVGFFRAKKSSARLPSEGK